MQQWIFLPESTASAESLAVSIQPRVQSHTSTSVLTLKIPTTGSVRPCLSMLFGHMKILHLLAGMGKAALVATVPYLGKATQSFPQEAMKY